MEKSHCNGGERPDGSSTTDGLLQPRTTPSRSKGRHLQDKKVAMDDSQVAGSEVTIWAGHREPNSCG